jgi:hypothetical protein
MNELTPQQRAELNRRRLEAQIAIQRGQQTEGQGPVGRIATQFGAGSQEGIAQMAGFPVDAVSGAIGGFGNLTGLYEPIENPVGGSEFFDNIMSPLRENVPEPQNWGERVARRVGEEVGATAVGLPAIYSSAVARAEPVKAAIVELLSGLGGGSGAAIANEITPDSMWAEILGQAGGGIAAGRMGARATGLGAQSADVRPGIEEQRMIADDAYGEVRADRRNLPEGSGEALAEDLTETMRRERLNPRLHPGANNVLEAIVEDAQGPQRIEDIENLRRLTTDTMPVTAAPADGRLAQTMRSEITDYLDNLDDPIADRLRDGRNAHRRASAATSVEQLVDRARLRAARTGSGGNEINAIRQNLSRILEQPRLQRSFTPSEIAQIRELVEGTTNQNFLRRLSRFAPSSGGLSAMLGIGGTIASPQVALPIMGATEAARFAGERSTNRAVEALLQSLAPSRVTRPGDPGITPIVNALLASRTAASAE